MLCEREIDPMSDNDCIYKNVECDKESCNFAVSVVCVPP